MTTKQKIAIAVGTGLVSAYMVIFVYQRIQRAKSDASVVSEDEALKILNKKSSVTEPDFTEEDMTPKLPNDETVDNLPSQELIDFEVLTGYGDY
jgi:hypothetical protein